MVVDAVRTADEAIRMVRTFTYHAVIADKAPPDMKGSAMYRALRDVHEHLPIMPVSYTHLTLPTNVSMCISRWSPYH